MIKIRAVIEHITFQNSENGYSIMRAKVKDHTDLVTLVGTMLDVPVGSVLLCEGDWKIDRKYGQQFVVESFEEVMPATVYGIEKYLGSGLVKGIGPKFAQLIVRQFGTDTIEVIETDIERLYEVPGIGKKRVEKIRESWEKQKDIKNVMLFLQGYGVSTAYAAKIYRCYGKESIDKVNENPYRLADDIWGIGFKTADGIANKMGYEKNDLRRCKSGLTYTLSQLSDEGHVYAEQEQLLKSAMELLEADQDSIVMAMKEMVESEQLIMDGDVIYLPPFYYAEIGTANKLKNLMGAMATKAVPIQPNMATISLQTGIEYDEVQVDAIKQAVNSKVMVLTGGPGTGKTTTTQGIIAALKEMGLRILLAAPTGRAAKRMSEATGIDQLPSVGAGNVLRDIIESERVPVVSLTRIFRQAQSSRIVMSAHAINAGKFPDISNGMNTDFFFIKNEDADSIATAIVNLVKNRLPKSYNMPLSKIQVLTPMQRGVVGSANLNLALQEALNPTKEGLSRGGYNYRKGDRVMQIRNNYDKEVFNGDLGYIESVNMEDRTLMVNFEDRMVEFEVSELDELSQAYATTIHKAQGSGYPIVVMPVLMKHYVMLQRNLIYTGITRAKKICVLIGSTRALAYAINNLTVSNRNTKLKERLQQ